MALLYSSLDLAGSVPDPPQFVDMLDVRKGAFVESEGQAVL